MTTERTIQDLELSLTEVSTARDRLQQKNDVLEVQKQELEQRLKECEELRKQAEAAQQRWMNSAMDSDAQHKKASGERDRAEQALAKAKKAEEAIYQTSVRVHQLLTVAGIPPTGGLIERAEKMVERVDELQEMSKEVDQDIFDFASEKFGAERHVTWDAPMTIRKFIELCNDALDKRDRRVASVGQTMEILERMKRAAEAERDLTNVAVETFRNDNVLCREAVEKMQGLLCRELCAPNMHSDSNMHTGTCRLASTFTDKIPGLNDVARVEGLKLIYAAARSFIFTGVNKDMLFRRLEQTVKDFIAFEKGPMPLPSPVPAK